MMSENLKIGVLKIMLHMFVKITWRILLKVMWLIFVKIIWRKFSPILALRLLHSAGVVTVVEQLGFAAISDIVMMGGGGLWGGGGGGGGGGLLIMSGGETPWGYGLVCLWPVVAREIGGMQTSIWKDWGEGGCRSCEVREVLHSVILGNCETSKGVAVYKGWQGRSDKLRNKTYCIICMILQDQGRT